MKHLIHQYSLFLGEKLHLIRNFPNSRFSLHHFQNITLQYLFPEFTEYFKNQLNKSFCWFFFATPTINSNSYYEEERPDFDY